MLAAIRALPDRQREALALRFYLDLSEEETARAMGVSRGTVKSATSRAVAALGRKLKEGSIHQPKPGPWRRCGPSETPCATRRRSYCRCAPDLPAAADEVQFGGQGARRVSLRRPGGAARPGSHGRNRRWRSKLAPIAAAVAVAAVAKKKKKKKKKKSPG